MRTEVGIVGRLDRCCHRGLHILALEQALEEAENTIGGHEAIDAVHRSDLLETLEQLMDEALLASAEQSYDVAAELEEVGQACSMT
jgi:hypothetical protein